LLSNAAISLQRVVEGFALGATCGFALGLAMGLSPDVEAFVRPLFTAVSQVPALGWIPLLMLMVGIGEPLKIIVIARAAGVPVALNTLAGVHAVPSQLVEVGQIFRFGRLQMLRHVVLPAAVPPMFTGIRYGLTHAWTALVAVELLASSEGLGYLLVWGQQMFQLDEVIAAMAAIGLIGYVMDYGLARIEAHLQRWRPVSVQAGAV
jgi:sulfonate transport system permease protein